MPYPRTPEDPRMGRNDKYSPWITGLRLMDGGVLAKKFISRIVLRS